MTISTATIQSPITIPQARDLRVTSPAVTQLRQLQQTLYEKAYQEAHDIVAGASRTILSYSAKFERSLPKTCRSATLAGLIEEIRRKRFVLYGDFHTLRQSQRG